VAGEGAQAGAGGRVPESGTSGGGYAASGMGSGVRRRRRPPQALVSRNNLAVAYESAEDLGRAIPVYEQALADSVRVLGADHPQTKIVSGSLARARQHPSVGPGVRTASGGSRCVGGPEAHSRRSGLIPLSMLRV
jgi:Tetratricopeptide repeat